MSGTITCYVVRDPDPRAAVPQGEPHFVGFRHDSPGHSDARQWALQKSAAGRNLIVVELVDGAETGTAEHFKDGQEV